MNLSSNRINPNTSGNARQAAPRQAAPARPQVQQANTLSNYGVVTRIRSLYPGQVIKGEVSDLRNTEVVVTLENNTIVAGKLQDGGWLAIGEKAAFKVMSASQENIVLQALPRTDMTLANSTAQKALEEAGLPKTPRNQQLVLELMNNQMPISKQSIQHMLQQVLQHKDIQIPTLVLLTKLQIPLTAENATQFENYQNNAHSLAEGLEILSHTVTDFVKQSAAEYLESSEQVITEEGSATTTSLKEAFSDADSSVEQASMPSQNNAGKTDDTTHTFSNTNQASDNMLQASVSKILNSILDTTVISDTHRNSPLPDTTLQLSSDAKQELLSILENFELPETQKEQILSDTASLRDVIHLIHSDFNQAYAIDKSETDFQLEESLSPSVLNGKTPDDTAMLRMSLFDSPIIQDIEEQFSQLQAKNNELGGYLDNFSRIQFSDIMNQFPLDPSVKEKISTGEISASELMRIIKNVLPFTDAEPAAKLLSSDTFAQMLQKEFMHTFLLSPEDIPKYGTLDHYYQKLSKQLHELEQLLDKPLLSNHSAATETLLTTMQTNAKEAAGQLNENMDFMKLLNQFFSYVQLPTNLRDTFTHAELFVYTRKKTLAKKSNPIHVLLRLDMEHLHALDIDVYLKDQSLTLTFAVNDEKTGKLLENNLTLLENALLEKGFLCNSSVTKIEQDIDIVKDFIKPENSSQEISRYSFDLRA